MTDTIQIPLTKPVYFEGKVFYDPNIDKALAATQQAGYQAMYIPQLIDTRLALPQGSKVWQNWWTTPSLIATGRSRQGNPVVAYAHTDNYFSDPKNIKKAVKMGLVSGAGIIPQEEFYRILDMDNGKTVFVVDYEKLRDSESGVIPIKNAMSHPQTVPFIGGKERAEKYLDRRSEVYGNQIGIWHGDDLVGEQPLGRLLFLGYLYYSSLIGGDLDNIGRFLGVRPGVVAAGDAQKQPTLEQILGISNRFVPEAAREEFRKAMDGLYNR